jgi:hypothetical protein
MHGDLSRSLIPNLTFLLFEMFDIVRILPVKGCPIWQLLTVHLFQTGVGDLYLGQTPSHPEVVGGASSGPQGQQSQSWCHTRVKTFWFVYASSLIHVLKG